jgi:hypothetical protein
VQLRNSLVGWLGRQSPYALIRQPNPVFDYEMRRKRISAGDLRGAQGLRPFYPIFVLVTAAYLFYLPVFLVVTFFIDLYYMQATSRSISQQMSSGEWDLLRLTPLHRLDILVAKYAAAQLRVWKVLVWEMACRAGGAMIIFVMLAKALFSSTLPRDMLNSSTLTLIGYFGVFATIYVLEPLWRMRAVVALGLAISARVHNPSSAVLVSFATLLTMRLGQALICLSISVVAVPLIGFLSTWNLSPRSPDLSDLLGYGLIWVVISLTFYGFYKILEDISLKRALSFAFRNDQ